MQHATAVLSRLAPRRAAPASDAPLAGLAGTDLARRFRHWRGASGRRHLFSVFPIGTSFPGEETPRFEDAVVLAVGRDAAGERRILAMDETGARPELVYEGGRFTAAVAAGADEIHVHLLAGNPAGRAAVLRDLDAA